jgi:chemotaxis protein CheX
MKVEYINPFIEASIKVIGDTTGHKPEPGKVSIKGTPYTDDGLLVAIGLSGEITGDVVISLNEDVACKIASAMMMGMPVPKLDEISKSAVAELCNMILGNTATIFSQRGLSIDITPPVIVEEESVSLGAAKGTIISIPLLFEDGSGIELDVSYAGM